MMTVWYSPPEFLQVIPLSRWDLQYGYFWLYIGRVLVCEYVRGSEFTKRRLKELNMVV